MTFTESEIFKYMKSLYLLQKADYPEFKEEALDCMETNTVSVTHICQTTTAERLCIRYIGDKLMSEQRFDIGGTFDDSEPDLWFYCSTSICLDPALSILNVFVCHRQVGKFKIGISSTNDYSVINLKSPVFTLVKTLDWFTFESMKPDETFHIKTFCFPRQGFKILSSPFENVLYIPISIKMDCDIAMPIPLICKIRDNHYNHLQLKADTADCMLLSNSGRKFPAHKILLSIHSHILEKMAAETNELFLDIPDEEIVLLLNIVYNRALDRISKSELPKLVEIGKKFHLIYLFKLMQPVIMHNIDEDNAFEMLTLAKQYYLSCLERCISDCIKSNPKLKPSSSEP